MRFIVLALVAPACGRELCEHPDGIVANASRRAFAGPSLSVVTLNVLSGGPFPSFLGLPGSEAVHDETLRDRLALQAEGLAGERPDVLVLQEVSGTTPARYCSVLDTLLAELRAASGGAEEPYNVAFARGDRDFVTQRWYSGVAILSRFELVEARIFAFPTQGTLGLEHRVALRVTLRGERGGVDVVATHLQSGGADVAAAQVSELMAWLRGGVDRTTTTILAGDFNLPPESGPIRRIQAGGFLDAWSEANPGRPGFSFGRRDLRDPHAPASERIDYVFLSQGTEVRGARLVLDRAAAVDAAAGRWLWPSDHNGIRVDLVPQGYAALSDAGQGRGE